MPKLTMTLYEALSKKKIYEDRLAKFNIGNRVFFGKYKESNKTIGGVDLDTAEKTMISNFMSWNHLISNIENLQAAINLANAQTMIVIEGFNDGQPITLVEAVTLNKKKEQRIKFLNTVAQQLQTIQDQIQRANNEALDENTLYANLAKLGTNDKKSENTADVIAANIEKYKLENTTKLFDPNKIVESGWIDKERSELDNFMANVHTAMMKANMTTEITVDLED